MITIFCNGFWLDMPANASIRIDEEMPQFASDVFQGDFSFPFELPETPTNVKALGHLRSIDVAEKTVQYSCEIYAFNVHMSKGTLVVQKARKGVYSVNLVKGLASFNSMSMKLSEFDYGGNRSIGANTQDVIDHANDCVTKNYPLVDYNFPMVRNNDLYGNANPDFSGIINRWDLVNQTFRANKITGGPSLPEINPDVLIPFPYLLYILKTCFAVDGYELDGTFVNHADIKQLLLYSNRGLDSALAWMDVHVKASGPYTHSENVWTPLQLDTEIQDVYDSWDGGLEKGYIHFLGKHQLTVAINLTISGASTVGDVMLRLLIDGTPVDTVTLGTVTNGTHSFTHTFDFTADQGYSSAEITLEEQFYNLVLGATTITINTVDLLIENDAPGIINQYAQTLNVANHVPDITFGELLRRLRGAPFFVNITPDRLKGKVYLDFTADTLSGHPQENLTNKVVPGAETTFERVSGYTVKMGFPSSDKLMEDNFKTVPNQRYLGEFANLQAAPASIDNLDYIIFIQNLNQYWISQIVTSLPQWVYYSDRHPDVVVGDSSTEVKAEITPLLMRDEGLSSTIIPHIKQKGQSQLFSNGTYSFQDTRVVFWKGLQENYAGDDYPFATSMNRLYDGTVDGELILRNDGSEGLADAFQIDWLNILMRGEILRADVNYNLNDLLNFIGGKKQLMFQTYLIRKRSTVYGKSVSSTELEMLKLS